MMIVRLRATPNRLKPIFSLKKCAAARNPFSIPRSRTAVRASIDRLVLATQRRPPPLADVATRRECGAQGHRKRALWPQRAGSCASIQHYGTTPISPRRACLRLTKCAAPACFPRKFVRSLLPMTRTTPPFRADVVGSLLRTAPLKEARAKREKGEISTAAVKEVEDREIEKIIEKQEEVGLKVTTDGEFRRSWWHFDFYGALDGMERYTLDHGIQFHGVQ